MLLCKFRALLLFVRAKGGIKIVTDFRIIRIRIIRAILYVSYFLLSLQRVIVVIIADVSEVQFFSLPTTCTSQYIGNIIHKKRYKTQEQKLDEEI